MYDDILNLLYAFREHLAYLCLHSDDEFLNYAYHVVDLEVLRYETLDYLEREVDF